MLNKPTHFIIVDDDAINNRYCKYAIAKYFDKPPVQTFINPEEALQFITNNYPLPRQNATVLFLDINMPQLSGWEFLDGFSALSMEIREQFIIYILSASADALDEETAIAHPLVTDYVRKPMTATVMDVLFSPFLKS